MGGQNEISTSILIDYGQVPVNSHSEEVISSDANLECVKVPYIASFITFN